MIDFTIIIPHFNSTSSLKRLLQTIPIKKGIQVIVIDDHSNNEHKKELTKMESTYLYRHIEFKQNNTSKKSAGTCRNIGLKSAKGTWVLFADSDDYFTENAFIHLEKLKGSSSDVYYFIPTSIELDTGKLSDRHIPFKKLINNIKENSDEKTVLQLRYRFVVPWSKVIKRNLIEKYNIEFDEVISANDVMFSTKVGYYMDSFEINEENIYCVTKNKGSLTMTMSHEIFDTRFKVFIRYYRFLDEILSKNEMNLLNLSGRGYLIQSLRFNILKFFQVFLHLKINHIRIFDKKVFNPFWLTKTIKIYYAKSINDKKYKE